MRNRELFLARIESLLKGDSPAYQPLPPGAGPTDRLARICRALTGLGIELWEGLPRPDHAVGLAAMAVAELGLLVSPPGTGPQAAAFLLLCSDRTYGRFRTGRRWGGRRAGRAASDRLARAFWCFTGVAAEVAGGEPSVEKARGRAAATAGHLIGFLSRAGVLGVSRGAPPALDAEVGVGAVTGAETEVEAPAGRGGES